MRIKFYPREKAGYLKLRRVGLSINQISKAFGRSTSVIHRTLVKAQKYGHNLDRFKRPFDMRKLPYRIRLVMSRIRWRKLLKLLKSWESWFLGEGVKPP